ncbi:MAG: nucleotide exchange factor GrpE [Bacteroidaceae bacterium]|nr:nucleotide exchange factor GrpE [Bacteroidaceae bacterium]
MSKKKNRQNDNIKEEELKTSVENTEEKTDTPEGETTDTESTDSKIAELEAKLAELKDSYLRQAAEFDNYRKRTVKEKTELILNGGEKILTALLPVLDDMERAEKNMEKSTDVQALKEGLNLISKELITTLENNGLKRINTENADFDTDFHEAVAMIPAPSDDMKGKVIDCIQTGYKLNDKVIRHAKVAVGQ